MALFLFSQFTPLYEHNPRMGGGAGKTRTARAQNARCGPSFGVWIGGGAGKTRTTGAQIASRGPSFGARMGGGAGKTRTVSTKTPGAVLVSASGYGKK